MFRRSILFPSSGLNSKPSCASNLYVVLLLGLLFYHEDGGDSFLQTVGFLAIHAALQPSRSCSSASSYDFPQLSVQLYCPPTNLLLYLLHGAEPFLRSCQALSYSRIYKYFVEPECSLPCSQERPTGPNPEPYQSSPYRLIISLLRSNLILSTHLHLGLPSGLFSSGFSTYMHSFSPPLVLHALPVSSSLT
jgi:hypothetical protein